MLRRVGKGQYGKQSVLGGILENLQLSSLLKEKATHVCFLKFKTLQGKDYTCFTWIQGL